MEITSVEIDHEHTPLGRLSLRRYQVESGETGYEILLDGAFLMASHGSHSERAMPLLAHRQLRRPPTDLHVLIGGLGAGHTLRAALDLEGVKHVVVAEIGAKVVEWNRRFFANENGRAVDDPRVEVQLADLAEVVAGAAESFDLILIDVDNGPGWLAAPANQRIYGTPGLDHCRTALRPEGVLAVWSPQRNVDLENSMRRVFGNVSLEDTTTIARSECEPPSFIYLATGREGPEALRP